MLYRFRSIDKLINPPYEELKHQYFFFAAPSELNDPLEGYVDFYWKADKIAWLGLFKNYVWQVYRTLESIMLRYPINDIKKMYFTKTEIHFKDTKLPKLRTNIETSFCDEPLIDEIATILAESDQEISPTVLQLILLPIHSLALFHANKLYENIGIQVWKSSDWLTKTVETITNKLHDYFLKTIKDIIQHPQNTKSLICFDQYFRLNTEYPLDKFEKEQFELIEYLYTDFPEHYVKCVTNLAYATWKTVCFNRTYADPKMWSHYADSHKGVCLMFNFNHAERVQLESLDKTATDKIKQLYIKPIDYTSKPSKINFFLTLGNLWGDERKHWLFHNGEKSELLSSIFENIDKWRDEYWMEFEKRFLRKGSCWESEQEERIVLDDSFYDHSSARKYKYDFNKLHGIVFGINTKLSDKKRIIKILKEKCKETMRDQFHIYQARYDTNKEIIETDLLMIIKQNSI